LRKPAKNFAFLFPLVGIVYLALNFARLQGLAAYVLPSICWGFVALGAFFIYGRDNIWKMSSKDYMLIGLLIGVSQVTVLVFLSFFTGFGKSPYQFTPTTIAVNMSYFLPILLAFEFSRACLIKSVAKKKVILGIGLIGLFYTLVRFPTTSFLTFGAPLETMKFISSDFLPTLAQSIVATVLALLGGPIASIVYLGSLDAMQWLSPILPNPGWAVEALIGTLVPTIGLVFMLQMSNRFSLIRSGVIGRTEARRTARKRNRSSSFSWMAITIIAVVLLWGSTGVFGFKPSVVASGSMRPAFDVGDLAITVQTAPETIRTGDVIQYLKNGEFIIHRVVEVYKSNGRIFFITKGDANNVFDDPVSQDLVSGKALFFIPKLGWISIFLRIAAGTVFDFFSRNLILAFPALAAGLVALIFPVYRYRSQPLRRFRRRIAR
jgi:signal peptidase